MAKLISKRYAIALFELAKENNSIEKFQKETSFILTCLEENHDFFKVLTHPQISTQKKVEAFNNIFKNDLSKEIIAFMSIILHKNREIYIKDILKIFCEFVDEYNGIKTAFVYSPVELTTEQINSIKQKLSNKLNKEIIIKTEIQPDLIAGIKINVDGLVIDNSIKKQLSDIKNVLINN